MAGPPVEVLGENHQWSMVLLRSTTMSEMNPCETPRSIERRLSLDAWGRLIRRAATGTMLGAAGYGVYFGAVYGVSLADASVSIADASWASGGIVAFAWAASELFVVEGWSLNTSLMRRLIVSGAMTIVSLLVAGPLCMLAGIELREGREALLLTRVSVALPVFLALALSFRRWCRLGEPDGR